MIDPLDVDNIQPSSVDLRLDRFFRVFRNHTMRVIDVKEHQEELTELVEIADDGRLHPAPGRVRARLDRRAGRRSPTTWSPGWKARAAWAAWACSSIPPPASSTPAGTGT